jgi:hypothetical protein
MGGRAAFPGSEPRGTSACRSPRAARARLDCGAEPCQTWKATLAWSSRRQTRSSGTWRGDSGPERGRRSRAGGVAGGPASAATRRAQGVAAHRRAADAVALSSANGRGRDASSTSRGRSRQASALDRRERISIQQTCGLRGPPQEPTAPSSGCTTWRSSRSGRSRGASGGRAAPCACSCDAGSRRCASGSRARKRHLLGAARGAAPGAGAARSGGAPARAAPPPRVASRSSRACWSPSRSSG